MAIENKKLRHKCCPPTIVYGNENKIEVDTNKEIIRKF